MPPDPVQRVRASTAVPGGLLLDPAADLVHGVEAELDHVERVEHADRFGQLGAQRGGAARNVSSAAARRAERAQWPGTLTAAELAALGEHVVWLMDFLHAHHKGEDDGLWPVVRQKNPAAGPLLDSLEADHQRIEPAAAALRSAGERYAESYGDDARADLVVALDDLAAVLFPHLDREVEEALPVVSSTITDGEWRAIEQKYNIKPKSLAQLGFEGHWLLDGIDPEGYDVVTHAVPAIPRFILLHGFARAYRRRAAAVWQHDQTVRHAAAR